MKTKQLSLFLENLPGHLHNVCKALADANINILTLSMADTQQFGILRLIVKDADKAKAVLEDAGCVVDLTEVVATEVADHPGGLADILEVIRKAELNVEYMYAFTFRRGDKAILVFRFNDPDAAVAALEAAGVAVIDDVEIYGRAE